MARLVATTILAYLLGSIPFTYLLGRVWRGIDLSQRGSGNLGGTNAIRVLGPLPGFLTGLADIGKATLAVYLARLLTGSDWGPALAAFAAFLGHNFSLYLRFVKGGKGVSSALGSFLYLAPVPTLLALAVGLIPVLFTRLVSLGALIFVALLPILLLVFGQPLPFLAAALAMAVLAFWRHRENLQRLRTGTERRLGQRE